MVQLCPPCRQKPDGAVTDHPGYWSLGNTPFQREAAYRVVGPIPVCCPDSVEAAVLKGWPLGTDKYKKDLEQKACQVLPAKRGRPFKLPATPDPSSRCFPTSSNTLRS
jgi:putative transposase